MSKVKKGGKGAKGKKKEPQETDVITEVEREFLNITITDLKKKVERLTTRCMELELSNEEYQKAYEQLDEDRADIIAYLRRQLQEKEDEISELKERLEGLQKKLEETIESYEAKINEMGHDYRVMSEQLTSEIKLLTGKLNALEEFRLQRDELMMKFKVQQEQMEEQEERHKQTLYDVEKKFIIGKDKLKKEMEARLLKLALDFQDATQLRIAATTHRVIRENIAINNELDRMLETHRFLASQNIELKSKAQESQTKAQLQEEEKDLVISRNMIQLDLINRLSVEYDKMMAMVGELQHSTQHVAALEHQLMDINTLMEKAMKHIATLEERLQVQHYENNQLSNRLNKSQADTVVLQKVLLNAMQSVQKTLKIQEAMTEDEAHEVLQRSNLLNNLLMLLNTANLPDFEEREDRVVALAQTSAVYGIGDLGLLQGEPQISIVSQALSEVWTVGSHESEELAVEEKPTGSFHFLSLESIGPSHSLSTTTEEEEKPTVSVVDEQGTEEGKESEEMLETEDQAEGILEEQMGSQITEEEIEAMGEAEDREEGASDEAETLRNQSASQQAIIEEKEDLKLEYDENV